MRRREILTGLAVAPCVALVPSIVKGEGFAACTVPQGRPFRRGYEFVRGDLALFTAGWPVRDVTYSLVYVCQGDVPLRFPIVRLDRWTRMGAGEGIPVNPEPGEYCPALRIPETAAPGEYQIRWRVRLENGEVREPVQPFWVGATSPAVDDVEYLRKALFRALKVPKKHVAPDGV